MVGHMDVDGHRPPPSSSAQCGSQIEATFPFAEVDLTKLRQIKEDLRRRWHEPVRQQGQWLRQVVSGYFNYHAVPLNGAALNAFRFHVIGLWRRALRRRSQKDRTTWAGIQRLAAEWIPLPRILHPWPSARFAVTHPRREPYALIGHVRFCAGGAQ